MGSLVYFLYQASDMATLWSPRGQGSTADWTARGRWREPGRTSRIATARNSWRSVSVAEMSVARWVFFTIVILELELQLEIGDKKLRGCECVSVPSNGNIGSDRYPVQLMNRGEKEWPLPSCWVADILATTRIKNRE